MHSSKKHLRAILKERRRATTQTSQTSASQAVASKLLSQPWIHSTKTIAGYWPHNGEINLLPLLHKLQRSSVTTLLPRIEADSTQLQFRIWKQGSPMSTNRFGIPEPSGVEITTQNIDVICVPLVAFDHNLNRLGMGGGYYDRTFAQLEKNCSLKPILCGVAYDYQWVENLIKEPWDISLDYVVTPKHLHRPPPPND